MIICSRHPNDVAAIPFRNRYQVLYTPDSRCGSNISTKGNGLLGTDNVSSVPLCDNRPSNWSGCMPTFLTPLKAISRVWGRKFLHDDLYDACSELKKATMKKRYRIWDRGLVLLWPRWSVRRVEWDINERWCQLGGSTRIKISTKHLVQWADPQSNSDQIMWGSASFSQDRFCDLVLLVLPRLASAFIYIPLYLSERST